MSNIITKRTYTFGSLMTKQGRTLFKQIREIKEVKDSAHVKG